MYLQRLIFFGQILKTKYYIYVKMFKKNKNMEGHYSRIDFEKCLLK